MSVKEKVISLFKTNTTKDYSKPTCVNKMNGGGKKPRKLIIIIIIIIMVIIIKQPEDNLRFRKSFQTKIGKWSEGRIIRDIKNLKDIINNLKNSDTWKKFN